jgi:hypothetical protein
MKKKFIIPVVWQMMGTITIEADSLEDAIENTLDDSTPLPTNGSYVEGSFDVDEIVYNK